MATFLGAVGCRFGRGASSAVIPLTIWLVQTQGLTSGFKPEGLFGVFHVLMAQGSFCNCEILHNVFQERRLRVAYWRSRAESRVPDNQHKGV